MSLDGEKQTLFYSKDTVDELLADQKRETTSPIVKSIESHYNIDLGVKTDLELAEKLRSEGLPSLAKLLTMKRDDLTLDNVLEIMSGEDDFMIVVTGKNHNAAVAIAEALTRDYFAKKITVCTISENEMNTMNTNGWYIEGVDTIHTDLLGDVPAKEIFTLEGGKRFVSLGYLEKYLNLNK